MGARRRSSQMLVTPNCLASTRSLTPKQGAMVGKGGLEEAILDAGGRCMRRDTSDLATTARGRGKPCGRRDLVARAGLPSKTSRIRSSFFTTNSPTCARTARRKLTIPNLKRVACNSWHAARLRLSVGCRPRRWSRSRTGSGRSSRRRGALSAQREVVGVASHLSVALRPCRPATLTGRMWRD